MPKIFIILYIFTYFFIEVKTINDILELNKATNCTNGYLIFNSTDIKDGETMCFEIRSKSITDNYISYYFFDDIEDTKMINENTENLYEINITNLIDKEEGLYKVYNLQIIKNLSEYENVIKGNYLVIFYYSHDNLAEITSIIKNQDKKEDKDKSFNKNYLWSLVALVVIFWLIREFTKSKKKKNEEEKKEEKEEKQKEQTKVEKDINKEAELYKERIIQQEEYIYELKKKNELQSEALKNLKENNSIKIFNELDKVEINDKMSLVNYIENVKNKYPDIPDLILSLTGKVRIMDLIHVTFQSDDQSIKYIVICQKTEKVNVVLNKIYETKPEFKEYHHFFLGNGGSINEYKTFEENKIEDGNGITIP